MNEKFEKIIEEARKVSLKKEEKDKIRDFLIAFIKKNQVSAYQPVIKAVEPRLKDQKAQLSWSQSIFVNSFRFLLKPMPLVLLLIVALTGGVSLASENALPGDLLYPVKVNINEEVRGTLTFSTEARADFETQRLNRRIEEAEKLAVEGKFDNKAKAKIESNFESHLEQINKEVQKLEAEGNFEASAKINSKFEASLKAHEIILEEVLDEIDEVQAEIRTNLNPLSLMIRQEAKTANDSKVRVGEIISERVRASEEAKVEAEILAKNRLKVAENKITESKKYIERARKMVNQEAIIEAETKIQAAESIVVEGKAKIESSDINGALLSFQEAFSLAQEAKVLAKAKIDLRNNVRLEFRDNRQNDREENQGEGQNNNQNDQNQNSDQNGPKSLDKSDESIEIKIDNEIKINPNGKIELNL